MRNCIEGFRNFLLLLSIFFIAFQQQSFAQKIEILAGNTFNGAMNGAMLGGATMALQNSNDIAPVRFGVGLGTIAGMGIGVYDMAQVQKGEKFFISGTFNDGNVTSIIILLDTFYGGVAGSLVGTAITLMSNQPVVEGLQYGSGAGLWAGFAFGLLDAFALSKPQNGMVSVNRSTPKTAAGLLSYHGNKSMSVGFVSPQYYQIKTIKNDHPALRGGLGLNLVNLNYNF